jgi:hypothetical protein
MSKNSDRNPDRNLMTRSYNSTDNTAKESVSVNLFEFQDIFLATKQAYFKISDAKINKLIKSLLNLNGLLKQEIDLLFSQQPQFNRTLDFNGDGSMNSSDHLLESCVECSINFDFVMNILWQRIHAEPIVMKFISLRYANYTANMAATFSRSNMKNNDGDAMNLF